MVAPVSKVTTGPRRIFVTNGYQSFQLFLNSTISHPGLSVRPAVSMAKAMMHRNKYWCPRIKSCPRLTMFTKYILSTIAGREASMLNEIGKMSTILKRTNKLFTVYLRRSQLNRDRLFVTWLCFVLPLNGVRGFPFCPCTLHHRLTISKFVLKGARHPYMFLSGISIQTSLVSVYISKISTISLGKLRKCHLALSNSISNRAYTALGLLRTEGSDLIPSIADLLRLSAYSAILVRIFWIFLGRYVFACFHAHYCINFSHILIYIG